MDPTKAADLARELAEQHFKVTIELTREEDASLSATVNAIAPDATIDVLRELVAIVDDWKQHNLTVEIPAGRLHVTFS